MAEEATLVALRELVTKYAQNRSEYLKPSYNETALRIEFLNPLFTLLGWDVDNERGLSIYAREVIHESTVVVDDEDPAHATKKPDYAFRVGGETQFFLEPRSPASTYPRIVVQPSRHAAMGGTAITPLWFYLILNTSQSTTAVFALAQKTARLLPVSPTFATTNSKITLITSSHLSPKMPYRQAAYKSSGRANQRNMSLSTLSSYLKSETGELHWLGILRRTTP